MYQTPRSDVKQVSVLPNGRHYGGRLLGREERVFGQEIQMAPEVEEVVGRVSVVESDELVQGLRPLGAEGAETRGTDRLPARDGFADRFRQCGLGERALFVVPIQIGIRHVFDDLPGERRRCSTAVAGDHLRSGDAQRAETLRDGGFDGGVVVLFGTVFRAHKGLLRA